MRASLVLLWVASSCSIPVTLVYSPPTVPPVPAVAKVSLEEVIDDRPISASGKDRTMVGRMRSEFGWPVPLQEDSGDEVARLVSEATVDALRQAALQHRGNPNRRLVPTIRIFFVDGYVGYHAEIVVDLVLLDRDGAVLWNASVRGGGGGGPSFMTGINFASIFDAALHDYSKNATALFRSSEFMDRLAQ